MLFADNIFGNSPTELPGDHRAQLNGILVAYGPDIKQGEKIEDAQLFDITPTVLHMMGLPIPDDIDGVVLKEIFKEDSEPAKRDIFYEEEIKDERKKVKEKIEKLKNLGKL
jgi:arylsulfatase A-like enzyme